MHFSDNASPVPHRTTSRSVLDEDFLLAPTRRFRRCAPGGRSGPVRKRGKYSMFFYLKKIFLSCLCFFFSRVRSAILVHVALTFFDYRCPKHTHAHTHTHTHTSLFLAHTLSRTPHPSSCHVRPDVLRRFRRFTHRRLVV